MIDYKKIKSYYFYERLKELAKLFENRHPIYDLNSGVMDKDKNKIRINEQKLQIFNLKYTYKEFDCLNGKQHFNIAYLLPHNYLTGGLKILIQQANALHKRGHNVSLYCHFPKPNWIDIQCKYFKVPHEKHLYELIPKMDVVIAGYWDLIIDALKTEIPLKYYMAQGDKDIFEYETLKPYIRNTAYTAHQLPVKILTVSKVMQDKLKSLYKRNSVLVPNAIDHNIFYPQNNKSNDPKIILLIGSDGLDNKGHNHIIQSLFSLKNIGYNFQVRWVMPTLPQKDYSSMGLNIQHHIRPTQDELGRLYRTSDIYISGSRYESFSLPPLENMASKTAVITTSNKGVKEYAIDGKNCLMYEAGNRQELSEKITLLLNSDILKSELVEEGIKIAGEYTWKRSIDLLENELIKDKDNLRVALLNI